MAAITIGSVEVDVIPSTRGIYQRLRDGLVPAATRAGEDAGNAAGRAFGPAMSGSISDSIGARIGQQIGQQIAARITAAIRGSIRDGITQGGQTARPAATRQGDETGGAFARAMKTRLEAAFRSLPKVQIDADTSEADSDLQALRARMETLAGKSIGIDIDAAAARAEIDDIEAELTRLGAAHPDVTVRADTAKARAELAAVREEIDRISANPGTIRLETDGLLGQRLRAAVQKAQASLPNINIGADTTPAQAEIASLRSQLSALSDARIGIDIDAATALAKIAEIQARLARLSASDADVAVRVDAAAAQAELAAIAAMADALDAKRVNIKVSAAQALSAIFQLTIAVGALAAIPAIPILAAGIGSITAAAVSAGVGVGALAAVAIPAFKQIGGALQAQKAAQDASTSATSRGGQAASQGASRALQMAGAQQALASAHRNAARQIQQAEQAVGDAVRSAAEANERAAQQVKAAKQSLADAVQQAADRQRDAAERVAQAEDSLADAQKTARQAQQDLTQARKDAATQLAELSDRVADAQLSERDAVLDVQEAQLKLRATQAAGAKVSLIDQQRAQLAYDQAVQRLKEQKADTKSLAAEKKAADKAGVEGSDTVKAAQDRLAAAEQGIADQQKDLAKARQAAARQQVDSQRQISEAQEKVAEASRSVSKTQEDGARSVARAQESLVAAQQSAADSISSAQRQIASASLSAAGGVDQAAVAQAKYRAELAKLTPAARDTFDAYVSLRSAFKAWSKSLQPQVMPLFTRALNGLKNSLPGLTPIVLAAARGIGKLQDKVSAGFKSPWWKTFKKDFAESVEPAIVGLGISFGRIFKGMGGIIQAFLPHMDSISKTMQRITGRFADWGASLKGSDKFEHFLDYAARMGPVVAKAIGDISSAFYQVAKALSPLSGPVLQILGALARGVASIAVNLPWLIQGIYLVIIATRLWTIAMAALTFVMNANPITLIIIGIVALVAAFVYAYKKVGWFRTGVQATWNALKVGGRGVINWFSGPFKRFFTVTIPGWFRVTLNWVKKNWPWILGALTGPIGLATVYIIKRWDKIKGGISSAWNSIRKNVLYPIRDFFTKTIPGWASSLKDKTIRAFERMRDGLGHAMDGIKARAKKPVQFLVDIVYNNGIRGVWNKIAGAFGASKLRAFKFLSGGVLPGYTPGKDPHKFFSPTGGALEMSGGEAIMRPEFTRAVGADTVGLLNSIAKRRGASGVQAALSPVFGGNPHTSTDRSLPYSNGGVHQSFADGGIFGWIGKSANAIAGAGSSAWNTIKKGASWLADTLERSARAGVQHVVDPLLASFPGMDTGIGKMIRKIPTKIIDTLFGYAKDSDKKGGSGIGGPKIQNALRWAKTQNGKPYQWAGNGNPSWDCSGFMSAIESVIRGQKPHRRWATGAFSGKTAPPGWVYHGNSPFKVGITNAGVGHTAGTLGKTNVESRGGAGVVVGSGARSYKSSLFNSWYGFKPGSYDSGGYLQPGMNLAYNGTGRPEPVFTSAQANALTRSAAQGVGDLSVAVYVGDREITDIARAEVRRSNGELLQVINAS